jgi:SOS response regulatory protein OraA/RecX
MAPPAPVVTALRPLSRGRVAVELDGAAWRVLAGEPVIRAGLAVGLSLDRPRARALRRALRAHAADRAALALLRHRDHSAAAIDARLERRGHAATERASTIDRLRDGGLLDDRRFAEERARSLVAREAGDRMIRADLVTRGVSTQLARDVVSRLEPERLRAEQAVARRGASRRTLRRLAARGFAEESLEGLVADLRDGAVP